MNARFTCPACGERFSVSSDEAGREKPCPKCGVVVALPGSALSVGYVLDNFQVCGPLEPDQNGALYQALDLRTGETVALRVPDEKLTGGPQNIEAFCTRINRLKTFEHPHLLRIVFVDRVGDGCVYGMEYCTGGSLSDVLQRGRIEEAEALPIMEGLADALAYLHQQQFAPLDLSASGVAFDDTGRAKWSELALVRGEADVQSNLYSLGVIVFEMLVGEPPLAGANVAKLVPASPATVQILQKLLAQDPSERFQNAEELLAALRPSETPEPETASPIVPLHPKIVKFNLRRQAPVAPAQLAPVPAPAPKSAAKTPRPLWELAGWVALLLIGGGALWWWFNRKPKPPAPQPQMVAATPTITPPAPPAPTAVVTAPPPSAVVTAALPAVVAAAKAGTPINVMNPGFETGFSGWKTSAKAGPVRVMTEAAHSGTHGVRLTDESTETSCDLMGQRFKAEAGTKYEVHCWMRYVSGNGVGLYLRFYDAKNKGLNSQTLNNEIKQVLPKEATEWTELSVSGTATEGAATGEIWVHTMGAVVVTADVDDFSLRKLE